MTQILEQFETKRLLLRKQTPEVLRELFKTQSDSDLIQILHLDSFEELRKEHEKNTKGLSTYNREFVWFQILEKETEQNIGWGGFHVWYTDHDRAEIGYGLNDDKHKNKGYMTEAIEFFINYGFEKMNLHRIEAFVGKDNIPSLKLMEKFGFEKEGHLKEHYLINGVYEDSLVFGLVKRN